MQIRTYSPLKCFLIGHILLLISGLLSCQPPDDVKEEIFHQIDQTNFSGSVLVSLNDTIVFSESFGYSDPQNKVPNDTATIYPLASITKIFIKHLVLNLINKGDLHYSDKLSKFSPEVYGSGEITIEHLLNHTSGLPDIHNELPIYSSIETLPDSASPAQLIKTISGMRYLHFTPGTRQQYSNSNYVLLAGIIEHISGITLEEKLNKEIFIPYGMKHSGLYYQHSRLRMHAIGFYTHNRSVEYMDDFNFLNFWGSGNAYSTVGDMHKYACEVRKHLNEADYSKLVSHTGYFTGINTAFRTIPEIGLCIVVLGNNGDCNAQQIVNNILDAVLKNVKEIPVETDRYSGIYEGNYLGSSSTLTITLNESDRSLQMNSSPMQQISDNVFCLPGNGYVVVTFSDFQEKFHKMTMNDNGQLIDFRRL